jgi:hypothetical protein
MPDRTITVLLDAWRSLERELEAARTDADREALRADIELLKEIQARAATRRAAAADRLGTDPRMGERA